MHSFPFYIIYFDAFAITYTFSNLFIRSFIGPEPEARKIPSRSCPFDSLRGIKVILTKSDRWGKVSIEKWSYNNTYVVDITEILLVSINWNNYCENAYICPQLANWSPCVYVCVWICLYIEKFCFQDYPMTPLRTHFEKKKKKR